jgi:hypothetical protein
LIAIYKGDGRRQRFINAGAWLRPGEAIAIVRLDETAGQR